MSKSITRRALVASTAAMPALAVPAAAADEDPELLALGVEFDKVAVDWVRQCKSDRACSAEHDVRLEAATGIPRDQAPTFVAPAFYDDHPDSAAVAYSRVSHQIWNELHLGKDADERWDDIHGRIWSLAKRIVRFRPKTVAGLALVARASSLICSEWFESDDDEQDADDRALIEAVCAFCGVMPLLVEAGAAAAESAS